MKLKTFNGKKGYDKLNILPFNRDFGLRNQLVSSIKENGFIVPLILCYSDAIDGIKKLYILDGQHKGMAAAYLDINFYGMILPQEPKTKSELVNLVSTLNSTQKAWNLLDYVNAYKSLLKQDYIDLAKYSYEYGYSILGVGSMLSGSLNTKVGNTSISNDIRTGMFTIKSREATLKTFKLAASLPKMNTRMIQAFHVIRLTYDKYDYKVFSKKFKAEYSALKAEGFDTYFNHFKSYF